MKKIFLIITIVIASALSAEAVTHRALIFGLGKYQDKSWRTIHGDNDVYYVTQMLMNSGFTDIKTLKNEQATKQGMVNAFIALSRRCQKGDIVYIHYSGHGQLMTDLDGDEALRTTARYGQWDESWVPYDAYMNYGSHDDGSRHFCDDEVSFYLSTIRNKIGKKGKMYVVIDACHSGDATCSPDTDDDEDEEVVRGVDVKFNIPKPSDGVMATSCKQEQWLTVSACKPYQLCMEMKGMDIGKLTYALYSLGKQMFTLSNAELQKRLISFMEMNKGKLPQTPVVSGAK